jgi:uncharacterized membrane protein YraQ (UPF0718 family)
MYWILWASAIVAVAISYRKDRARTLKSLSKSLESLRNLLPGLLGMIAFVGLALAVVPKELLIRLFAVHGMGGLALVSLIGATVTIPGPIAFPLAGALLKMGAAPAALASFVTTLTMVGIVTSPLEASFFGVRFTVIRQALSFVAAVLIGTIMGFLL